jgi:uncharacterized membrane protein
MKALMLIGIVLIVIGVIALAYGGFSFTTSEKVAEVGPLKIEKDKTRSVPLPPVLGGLVLVGGIMLVVVGARKESVRLNATS